MADSRKYWFKRRRYGWGWTPITWQGWLVLILWFAIAILGIPAFLDAPEETDNLETALYFMSLVLATLALIRLGYLKGPRPKWRWGKSPSDDPMEDI